MIIQYMKTPDDNENFNNLVDFLRTYELLLMRIVNSLVLYCSAAYCSFYHKDVMPTIKKSYKMAREKGIEVSNIFDDPENFMYHVEQFLILIGTPLS